MFTSKCGIYNCLKIDGNRDRVFGLSTGSKAIPAGAPSHYLWQVWAEDFDGVQSVERGSKQGSYILQVSRS